MYIFIRFGKIKFVCIDVGLCYPVQDLEIHLYYAPNFEKVGEILVSTCPYVICMYVCVYVFMFEISS